ncbi:MAG: ABC transporter ATP-binding protein [Mucinivorans sp.]
MIINARDIYKTYGSLEVLSGVSLTVERGEILAILGRSGAGKTTLLQIMSTLLTPTSGSVELDGQELTRLTGDRLSDFRARKIGFVFQAHHLLPEFSAMENVALAAQIAGVKKVEAENRALELLKAVGLADRAAHKPATLSGGEAQRVAVARALINRPAVVFADEPSGNLDSHSREDLHRLFFDLRQSLGATFVIVTHDMALAELCDRRVVISDGKINV